MVKKSLNVFPSSQKLNHDNFFGVDHFDFAASGDHLSLGDTLPGTGSTGARARIHIHTSFFHAPPPFFQRVFTFAICFISFLFFCMNSISQIGFHFEKCSCYLFFFGMIRFAHFKNYFFVCKNVFSVLYRFGFALPFYFVKQTARCTKFGLVRATTTHF